MASIKVLFSDVFWAGLVRCLYTMFAWAFFSALLTVAVYCALLLTPHATPFIYLLGYTWATVTAVGIVLLAWQAPIVSVETNRWGDKSVFATPWPPAPPRS